MNVQIPRLMTAEEFVAWAIDQELGRCELIDGLVVKMNAECSIHVRVKLRAAMALGDALKKSEIKGEVFGDGMAVKIVDRLVHEPDTLLRLGPPLADNDTIVTDPVIVVEVLSPSTGPVDTSTKLVNYFRLPSVMHYLIIDTTKRLVLHYSRGPDGQPVLKTVREGELALSPPGLKLRIEEFFAT